MEQLEDRSLLATLSIGPGGLHVPEGGTATLQVTISQMQMQPVSGTCRTVAGTAIENTDYTGFSNQSFTIPPGATFANISVYALNDIDLEGPETFSVELTSASGATIDPSASSTVVTIDNVQSGGGGGSGGALTVSLSVPSNVNEGESFTMTGSINTTGSYQVSGTIDWGVTAGEGPATFSVTTNPNGTFSVSHRYVDDGPDPGNGTPQDLQPITITGTAAPMMPGGSNLSVTGSTSTTIHNVAPTPVFDIYNYMPIGGPWWVAAGTFQDVGLTDKGSLDIDWGDGSPHVTGTGLNVGSTFSEMHRYPPDGLSYTITITITDDDTGSATYSESFPLYLLDLDNDANNNGEIAANDEPLEPDGTPGSGSPGRFISVNGDDDNENGIVDMFDLGSVSNENDLEPFELKWAPAIRPEINNYEGWKVKLQIAPYDVDMANNYPGIPNLNPHVYTTADKSSEIALVDESPYLTKTWIVNETVPSVLYLEARRTGPIGMRLLLTTPDGQEVEVDQVLFTAIPADTEVDLIIHDGQGGKAIPDADEDKTGAVTVANLNDTDADGNKDFEDSNGVVQTNIHGRNEVDLMLLEAKRPVGYVPGTGALLWPLQPERVRLWADEHKVIPAPGYDAGAGVVVLFWGANDYAPKRMWVEIISKSDSVADIQIDLSYGGKTDTVKATGVWSILSDIKFSDTNWNAVGAPWKTEMDKALRDQVSELGGTGVRQEPYQIGVGEISFPNVILFQFTVFPTMSRKN